MTEPDHAIQVSFILNSEETIYTGHPLKRLLDVLREDFGLTGVKEGCAEGECGACVVLMDQKLVNSCLIPIFKVENTEVLTIEGFKHSPRFDVLKSAFEQEGAVQCGFCTPGMIMASEALLTAHPHPTRAEIIRYMSGNLCRCTGYEMIIKAVQTASERGNGLW